MVGFSDVSHCDECGSCEPTCNIGDINIFDVQCSSGFIWDVNKWITTTVAGQRSNIGSDNPWKLTVTFLITWQNTTAKNITLRIAGGMSDDCLSYWFSDYIWARNGSDFSLRQQLGASNSGSESILGSHPYITNSATDYGTLPPETGTSTVTMRLCWDGDSLTIENISASANIDADATMQDNGHTVQFGNKVSFSVRTMSGVTSVAVTSVTFERVDEDDAGSTCAECQEHDCYSLVPPQLLVEISSMTSVDADCMPILGTFTVTTDGDGSNTWTYVFNPGTVNHTIRVTIDRVGTNRSLVVHITRPAGGFGGTIVLASFREQFFITPCEDWTDWINVETNSVISQLCSPGDELTCRIKIVP